MWELDNLMRAIYIIIKFGAVYNTVMKKKKKMVNKNDEKIKNKNKNEILKKIII